MTPAYESFGRVAPPSKHANPAGWAIPRLREGNPAPGSLLAYGNGRSYGDTCLNEAGVVDMRDLDRILAFDAGIGVMTVEAGVLLSDVIAHAEPHGFFPAVVPGTQFVTVGGAIANDIHGKNHHRRGTFGAHVVRMSLLRSDGRTYICSPTRNAGLFAATIGGMGLTGLILQADIRLMRVSSIDIAEEVLPFGSLAEYFDLAESADAANEYAVAWVDQLATGRHFGRGLLITGNHLSGPLRRRARSRRLAVPFTPPVTVLNRPFLKLFNAAYRFGKGRTSTPEPAGYRSFFFPLDAVRDWNRLYGPRGLHQHQSVIPFETATAAIPAMLRASQDMGQGSFLTVLKRFGATRSPGVLSFPRPGYTLTLDFPNRGAATLALLAELDRLVVEAGGAVNPYKDSRMGEAVFAASFPNWQALEARRDKAFSSDFWRRTAMRLDARQAMAVQAAE